MRYIAAEARLASIQQIRRVLDYDDLLVRSLVLKMRVLAHAIESRLEIHWSLTPKVANGGAVVLSSVGAEIMGLRMEGVLAAGGDG